MKELLLLCTENVHFSFNGQLSSQTDGIAMGSPSGPVIAKLERNVIPELSLKMTTWKRYADDTITYVNPNMHERGPRGPQKRNTSLIRQNDFSLT